MAPAHQPRLPWARANNLIDGLYGFAATVLMLRLAVPVYEEGRLGAALVDQIPSYLLYVLGFLQIVGSWSVLRRLSSWSTGIDFYGMVCAFLTMLMWATTPFAIDVMAGAADNEADFASAVRLMAYPLVFGMVAYTGLFWRLERTGSFRDGLDPDVFAAARVVSYTVVAWPVTVIVLSYVSAWAGLAGLVGLVALSLIPLEAMSTEQYAEAVSG
jgi:uncharacterized membrane protein